VYAYVDLVAVVRVLGDERLGDVLDPVLQPGSDDPALTRLPRAEPCTVTVTQARIRITWTIRPVLFLPLVHRQGLELPACAYAFKPGAFEHPS
jgi:hypothetical protein